MRFDKFVEQYRSHKGRGVRLTLEVPQQNNPQARKAIPRDNHDDRDDL